jgi:hypothetical protein
VGNINSYADHVVDWERLISAWEDVGEDLEPARPQRIALSETISRLYQLKAAQVSFTAQRQQVTQEIRERVKIGQEQARRLRGMVKGLLGTQSERLVQFGIIPVRPRGGAAVRQPDPPTEELTAPAAEIPTE